MLQEGTSMNTTQHKTAGINKFLLGSALGGTAGVLYGMGDNEHNYANNFFHKSTGARGVQGLLSGAAGVGGYKFMRGLNKGRVGSGLVGLLSAAGAAALANRHLPEENPYKLPF